MSPVLFALAGGYGVYLLYTAFTLGWSGLAPGPGGARPEARGRARVTDWLGQAGLGDARISELAAVMAVLAVVGAGAAFALFGGMAPALVMGAFTATIPIASWRHRREQRLNRARDAWPRMLEEVRLQTGSLGRSVPQALLDVGRRGPEELRPAFVAAEREWLISTDFARTCAVLKSRLADPTADATCETLLVAHEVGGTDLDRRLASLVEDRIQDLNGRKDARAKQAGVRFARRFVLAVPVGMALAGLSIGTGRAAYETAGGQAAVGAGILSVIACWLWAGRLLRLPEEERVFHR
jgi:tight adherence protein B